MNFEVKKFMALTLFEFQDEFMIATFLIQLTHFEKTGSIGSKIFISLGKQR